MMTSDFLDAALYHHAAGRPVIAVKQDKKPTRPWGKWHHAKQTEEEVRNLFSQPAHGLAILTWPASDLIVLDFDGPHAESAWNAQGIELPETARAMTKSGGVHLIFRIPRHTENGTDFKRKVRLVKANGCGCAKTCGVDFLVNGYFITSPTPGYHEDPEATLEHISLIPEEVLKLTAKLSSSNGDGRAHNNGNRIREGERNATLTSLAGTMQRRGVSYETLLAALKGENRNKCDPPLDEREVEAIAKSVSRYQPENEKNGGKKPEPSTGESATNRKKQAEFWPELLNAAELLSLPPDLTRWVWDQVLPFCGSSVLVSKPKVGKSTLAVNLSITVARGAPFLGRDTIQCPVAYLSLDASLPEIAETFIRFGLRETDPIFIHAGAAPKDAIRWLVQRIREKGVRFVVVDTLQRLFRFQNLNDYSEVTNTLEPLLEAVRELSVHVMFLHHAKKDAGDDLDSAIGSTAIRGLAYAYLHLKRLPGSNRRILRSDQRGGKNFSELQVGFGKSEWLEVKGTMEEAEIEEAIPKIVEVLETESAEQTEREIRRLVPLRGIIVSKAMKQMFKTNTLERTGYGKKGNPFRYSLASTMASSLNSCPRVGGMGGGDAGHESPK